VIGTRHRAMPESSGRSNLVRMRPLYPPGLSVGALSSSGGPRPPVKTTGVLGSAHGTRRLMEDENKSVGNEAAETTPGAEKA